MTSLAYMVQLTGWVLLQFVWQGAVVLALMLLGRHLLRHSRAQLRHDLAMGALVVLVALPPVTASVSHRALRADPLDAAASTPGPERVAAAAAVARAYDASAPAMSLLVGIWAAGVVWGAVSMVAGRRRLERLRRGPAGPDAVAALTASLAPIAGLHRAPRVVESPRAATPLVAGWRSPVLVLPRGLTDRIGRDEMRAVLLHELAHIRRRDYLVNLAQRAVEVALWFHPAVRIVSREIREQREFCCDDEAASAGAGRLTVARALLTLEELRGITPPLALGGAGAGGGLGARVRHLAAPAPAISPRDTLVATTIAVAITLALAASARLPGGAAPDSSALRNLVPVVDISATDPAGPFAVRLIGGRAAGVSVSGLPVPARQLRQRGRVVEVLDRSGQPALRLSVDPDGRGLRWSPRSSPSP